ncbi:DUF6221 family protein [[Kitasatospora] papulosa]
MTAQGENILAYLERAITSREHTATEAAVEYGTEWYYDDGLVLARHEDDMVATGSQDFLERPQGEHIALNDPASVLRRCAADRKLIAEHGPFSATDLSCKGCGLDSHEEMVTGYYEDCPVLCALAEGYGWTEGER